MEKRTESELEAPLDAETNAMIAEAIERAALESPPMIVTNVFFNKESCVLIVTFSSGRRLAIPQEDVQYLADATVEDAADVSIEMLGRAVHWEKLNLDFSGEGLSAGLRGDTAWMKRFVGRGCGNPNGAPELSVCQR